MLGEDIDNTLVQAFLDAPEVSAASRPSERAEAKSASACRNQRARREAPVRPTASCSSATAA